MTEAEDLKESQKNSTKKRVQKIINKHIAANYDLQPEKLSEDQTEDEHESPIKEADYLKGDKVLPFSSSLKSDIYLKLKRVEYWKRMSVREILEEALTEYINKQPTAKKTLPAKERNKLKQLKTAKEYFKERISKARPETE